MHLEMQRRLRLGVSRCLTGDAVRYDGGHKRDHWVMDRVAAFSDLVPVCPEEILGVPREPIRMERDPDGALRVRGVDSGGDRTDTLARWASQRLDDLDLDALDGWIFKSGSPSCALEPVDVFGGGEPAGRERGRFADAVLERCGWLPAIDETGLADPATRRHFLERAFARAHWRAFLDDPARDGMLDEWLGRFELQLLARERAPLGARGNGCDPAALRAHGHLLFASLDAAPTRAGQVAALRRAGDHLDVLDDELAAFSILVSEYASGRLDVEVPRQLLRGLCARGGDAWLRGQRFLDPFPPAWRQENPGSAPWSPRPRATEEG